jgi:membrane-associated phospholipid phosphatase
MALIDVVSQLLVAAALMLVVAGWLLVGPERLRTVRSTLGTRLRVTAPFLVALGIVLAADKVARDVGPEVSWVIGLNVTGLIYRVEGDLVASLQAIATPGLTAYLSFVYLAGYVFLLTFPIVAYFALGSPLSIKRITVAYAANYAVGLACYVLFIAYGPRNLIPDAVDPLLYSTYPAAQLLTSEVNTNVNVFPSLHASLATTVAIMAYRTRDVYPGWFLLAVPLAASVAFSTMYLGIHWATDVAAGVLLGAGSVYIADTALPRGKADGTVGWRARG